MSVQMILIIMSVVNVGIKKDLVLPVIIIINIIIRIKNYEEHTYTNNIH